MSESNDFLIITDLSYFQYFCIFGSVTKFSAYYPDEASQWIKHPDEVDQEHLPNLLDCENYRKVLKKHVMKRLETIDYIAKQNFQNELDTADRIDIIFAMDDNLKNNFRLNLYPTYKGQRRLVKRSYNVYAIKEYIQNVIFSELDVENQYGYHFIKVTGAEGDDVIATTLLNFKDRYKTILLISSDHDYLQIDGINQFDMNGKQIVRDLGGTIVNAEEYLLGKILMGDKSDNISQVFPKCGPKTALKLVKDKELLKQRLTESQDAIKQFQINKKIISFSEIPKTLSDDIIQKINVEIYDRQPMKKNSGLAEFMEW